MTVFGVRSISFERLVVFTNNFARMSAIMRRCAMLMFDQGQLKVKVKFKIKHCMTVFWVRSLSFEPLVGFTNYFPEMLAMITRCAVSMFDQCRLKVKVKNNPLSHVAHGVFITFCDRSSLRFHLPLQKKLISSSDIRGRHDCLRFQKHPSSFNSFCQIYVKCVFE